MRGSRLRHAVAAGARKRAAWAVPLLLGAAMLLVAGLAFNLAYLDTGGEQLPTPPSSPTPSPGATGILSPETASEMVVLFLFVGGVLTVILYLRTRRRGIRGKRVLRPTTWLDVVAAIIAFSIMGLLLFLWPRIASAFEPRGTTGTGNTSAAANGTNTPTVSGIPLGVFLAAALLVSLIAIALFFQLGSNLRRQAAGGPGRGPRRAAAQALQAAIDELELGGDVRDVILGCYARFCALLGSKGIAEQDPLTPREIEGLAQVRLGVSPESSDALTSLFEEARYSEHRLGDADRDRAVSSLQRIRMDLGV